MQSSNVSTGSSQFVLRPLAQLAKKMLILGSCLTLSRLQAGWMVDTKTKLRYYI